jgi:probable rRNA maturation factor
VLSFPQFELLPGIPVADQENDNFDRFELEEDEKGEDYLPLGDMAISVERAAAQAEEYGNSVERELGYLCVHSVLHLLGYDHIVDEEAQVMERLEDAYLAELSPSARGGRLTRHTAQDDGTGA